MAVEVEVVVQGCSELLPVDIQEVWEAEWAWAVAWEWEVAWEEEWEWEAEWVEEEWAAAVWVWEAGWEVAWEVAWVVEEHLLHLLQAVEVGEVSICLVERARKKSLRATKSSRIFFRWLQPRSLTER